MKKLISGLLAFTVIASSASNVVACGAKSFNDIFLVTDAGRISDKSFNESGKNAGDYFIKEILEVNKNNTYAGIGFNEPHNETEIPDGYNIAKESGAKVAILPGFHHAGDNLKSASSALGENGTEIFIDGRNEGLNTVIGLLYKADMSGFYAGIAAIYQTIKDNKEVNKTVKLATFGGQTNYIAVELFMVGFLAAIDVFNYYSENIDTKDAVDPLKDIFGDVVYKGIKADRISSQKSAPTSDTDANWYSNSFLAGEGSAISEKIVAENPNVVMPVAGPQTADLLGVIKTRNKLDTIKVVGVDTNQAEAYSSSYSNSFITSAEKNIKDSTVVALASSKEYYNNETVTSNIKKYYDDNKLSMTFDDNEKDIKDSLGTNLSGKTIWTPGDISQDGNNLLTSDIASKIKTSFSVDKLKLASNNYFKNQSTYKSVDLLKAVEDYTNKIKESFAS
ncbi:ribose/galactose ABC transporter substrate-binding protein [Spiroplasma corruscae]|uniref:Ribose/galactose ABC transporter substrate-binding protein n=1 Tax=Spiroplasma corruscae TaxID=216934 RepID=A0A222ENM4_9MOLU|nr:hypothetical protein [Spiroplasma corruscae]ASP28088.1 ribose/galactose ABC transporter substrate-binding protein [Spiroplasma corruscae]